MDELPIESDTSNGSQQIRWQRFCWKAFVGLPVPWRVLLRMEDLSADSGRATEVVARVESATEIRRDEFRRNAGASRQA